MEDEKKNKPLSAAAIGMGQTEIVQKHGEAASQFIQAYTGQRVDSLGTEIPHAGRSLQQISQYKVKTPLLHSVHRIVRYTFSFRI